MSENSHEQTRRHAKYWKLQRDSNINTRQVMRWKKEHGGILPKRIWLNTLETAGSYSCVEIIPYDPSTGFVYLKRREDKSAFGGEKKWEGKLHVPGLSELSSIRGGEVLPRLLKKEIFKDSDKAEGAIKNLTFLTQARYPEPERKTTADTLVLLLPVDPSDLMNDFTAVKPNALDQVIDQHLPLINAYFKGNVPPIFDSRPV